MILNYGFRTAVPTFERRTGTPPGWRRDRNDAMSRDAKYLMHEAQAAWARGWRLTPGRENRRLSPTAEDPVTTPIPKRVEAFLAATIEGEATTVRAAPFGQRHARLNTAAFKMGGYRHLGLAREVAFRALCAAAKGARLPERDIERAFERAWRAGAQRPRPLKDRLLPPPPRGCSR